jgi:phage baseplate assembly protein W
MKINWAPESVADEVVQNVNTLLATAPGTVPLSRDMGTPQDVVDQPIPAIAARLQASVIKAVRTYEPRAAISAVRIAATVDGKVSITAEMSGVKP